MARQSSAAAARDLAVALHDIAWLLPRKFYPWAEVGLQPSNASATIRALVARGLLERRRDGRDGRISRLAPTARAQAIRRQREEAWGELLRARLRRLQPEDAARLLD